MHRVLTWFISALVLIPAGVGDTKAADVPTDARFDFLKRLEGSWAGANPEQGRPDLVFEFRVTAGGHAVEEREMIGTPHEMLTVYHMDGEDLVATHYCMLGNRPRVKAARRVVDDALRFDCAGTPGGARSHDEEHVHGWTMRIGDDGKLHYSAELRKADVAGEAPTFVLSRR